MRQQQDRIDAIQKQLDEKGIIDIKFFFDNEIPVTPETVEKILLILESHLRGESKLLKAIGDKLLEYAPPNPPPRENYGRPLFKWPFWPCKPNSPPLELTTPEQDTNMPGDQPTNKL